MRRNHNTIFVQGRSAQSFAAVIDKLLAELLAELIRLSTGRVAAIDVVLHVFEESIICLIDDSNASRRNVAIDGRDVTVKDVVPHEESVLAYPIPGRVEVACLKRLEDGLNAINIAKAVNESESSRVICENHSCKSSPSLIFLFSHGSESKSRNQ